LTRARVIAGPRDLRERVEGVIRAALTATRDPAQVLTDVAEMRSRLDRERPAKTAWDLKEAKGGLFDVEFIAQGLQLVHAQTDAAVLQVNTSDAIRVLASVGFVAAGDAEALADATRLYQNVTQVLRLTVEGSFQAADASDSLRALITKQAGLGSFEEVEARLIAVEGETRALFERLIGPAS
jgi:glutamate-ammonia-ligase adenylyltransferase